MTPTEKLQWMQSLKVGDVVCDCRFQHLRIVYIDDNKINPMPSWLKNIILHDLMPNSISSAFDTFFSEIFRRFGKSKLVDKDLVLEDGSQCSAMYCCNPYNHEWEHPEMIK